MSDPHALPHEWFERRLALYVTAMLDADDDARVDAHLATCAACSDAAAALRERDAESGARGHLPADLLAGWPRRAPALGALERRLVREHLQRCDACRADLALLGHSPALVADAARPAIAGRIAPGAHGRRWFATPAWWGGALATAAAVVVVSVLVNRPHAPLPRPGPPPVTSAPHDETVPPPGPATTAARAHAPALAIALEPASAGRAIASLAEVVRGATPAGTAPVTLAAGANQLAFRVPATLLQAELPESLGVQLVSPAGRVLAKSRVASRALYPHRAIVLRGWTAADARGGYAVRFVLGADDDAARTREYRFTLQR
jgi:hypothetical protein